MTAKYEIKGLKTFKGHEGEPCAQGNLYRDAKKVAEWGDDTWSGDMVYHFISKDEENKFAVFAKTYLDGKSNVLGEPFNVGELDFHGLVQSALEHMGDLAVDEYQMRKECAKGLVFTMKNPDGSESSHLTTFKLLFTENEVARLKAANPELDECVNARFGPAMKDGSPEHLAAEKAFYKKECKTKTLYVRVQKDGRRAVYVIKQAFSAALAKGIRTKFPDVACILNEVVA